MFLTLSSALLGSDKFIGIPNAGMYYRAQIAYNDFSCIVNHEVLGNINFQHSFVFIIRIYGLEKASHMNTYFDWWVSLSL